MLYGEVQEMNFRPTFQSLQSLLEERASSKILPNQCIRLTVADSYAPSS